MMKLIRTVLDFVRNKIWEVRLAEMNPYTAFLVKQLRIVLIVFRNFKSDKLPVQSAGLTFYTILSVVPVVALAFAIAKGFGLEEALDRELGNLLAGQEDVAEYITLYASRMLENTKGGILAIVGVGVLLWTVIRLLSNVEQSFNDIWKVEKGRTIIRKFTDYFSIILLAPILLIAAGSITVVISSQVESLVDGVDFLSSIGPFIFFLIRLIPYALIWMVFTIVYMVIPNTRVDFKYAFIAGIIAGTSFQVLEWGYIGLQIGVSRYNAIYGSFAALPLFMVWANFSWLITLIGAEIAYANQYVENVELEVDAKELSQRSKKTLAIVISQHIFSAFDKGEPAFTARQLSHTLDIPYGVTTNILRLLQRGNILVELESDDKNDASFQPARSVENVAISDVFEAIDSVGSYRNLKFLEQEQVAPYIERMKKLRNQWKESADDTLVKDLPTVIINAEVT